MHARQALPARRLPRRERRRADRRGARTSASGSAASRSASRAAKRPSPASWRSSRRSSVTNGEASAPAGSGIGARLPRNEDARLLTGRALFVDDIALAGNAPRRVPAQRRTRTRGSSAIDVERARAMAGRASRSTPPPTWATTGSRGRCWCRRRRSPGAVFHQRTQVPLAKDKVRHVGEPIAMVVAESRYLAEDAARRDRGRVRVPRPPWWISRRRSPPARRSSTTTSTSNLAAHVVQTQGRLRGAAAAGAPVRSRAGSPTTAARRRRSKTAASSPTWDARTERLTVWDTTQAPIPIRNGLAAMLGLSEHQVRVVAPFIGGGFGPKIMMFYPEEVLVPWVAMRLGRPVKWMRTAPRTSSRPPRSAADPRRRDRARPRRPDPRPARLVPPRHRRLRSVRPDRAAQQPGTRSGPTACRPTDSEFRAVFTNKPIVTPYRGAGRQHGVFVIERLLDLAARELGIDRIEIRRRNFLAARRVPARQRDHLPGLRPAHLRQRQLPAAARRGARADRLRRASSTRRAAAPARRRAGAAASAWSPTSRAPASARSRARGCRCRRAARSPSPPASARRGRGTSPRSRRSWPSARRAESPTSTWSPATPTSSTGAPAPSPAAARWWPATPSTRRRRPCAAKALRARRASSSGVAESDVELADGVRAGRSAIRARRDRAGRAGATRQPAARRGRAGHRAGARGDALLRPRARRHRDRRARHDRRGRPRDDDGRRSRSTSSSTTAAGCSTR